MRKLRERTKVDPTSTDAQTSTRWAAGGSVVAAVTASACCLGPAAATALGIGGFGAAAALAPWRPWFLALTAVMLGAGFYLAYRRPKGACAEGAACARAPGARWTRRLLWVSAAMTLLFATFPYYSPTLLRAASSGPNAVPMRAAVVQKVTIPIEGMYCPACAVKVERALRQVPGVRATQVTYRPDQAVVEYDAAVVSREALLAAINATGYRAKP